MLLPELARVDAMKIHQMNLIPLPIPYSGNLGRLEGGNYMGLLAVLPFLYPLVCYTVIVVLRYSTIALILS